MTAGVCLRLYSEEAYFSRPEFTDPEIRRTNLASVVLKMLSLDLGEIEKFRFLDPPERAFIRVVIVYFVSDAVTGEGGLKNQKMVVLPIDPVLKMLITAREQDCLGELVIVSAMSIKDPRERPLKKTSAADEQHARFNIQNQTFCRGFNFGPILKIDEKYNQKSIAKTLSQRIFIVFEYT